MCRVPANPKIYHITHLDNLPEILTSGVLLSDAQRVTRGLSCEIVGLPKIKQRRLEEIEVGCNPGTRVGQYVPFYFCPRSIMLYILHMGNHPDLTYHGGQHPIVHLEADMLAATEWAEQNGRRWAFSDRNAGAYLAKFHNSVDDLDQVNWTAVGETDFRDPVIREGKQAEFLVYESFPWQLVEHIGVIDSGVRTRVEQILRDAAHKPVVSVQRSWYY